ncbi:MAG: hypothetical protein SFV55_28590 [Haliscomenobacter sp.]|uniref:hypothetical protein n=1 Tax=Haliscomenobacter sp. TaxID=2717303 RepID=UPI0029A8F48E|nr:hypothetical protein [Haliscomenobacter sp.]MDX2072427.1 hypothetical protein [Haliscomenobacter sp.]
MDKRAILQNILSGKFKPSEIPGDGVLVVRVAGDGLFTANGVVVNEVGLKKMQKRFEICMFWGGGFPPELTATAHKISFKRPILEQG